MSNHPNRRQPKFRLDNTEGYTAEQLAVLNRRYDARMEITPETDKSISDKVAEAVLAEFDAGLLTD